MDKLSHRIDVVKTQICDFLLQTQNRILKYFGFDQSGIDCSLQTNKTALPVIEYPGWKRTLL